VGVPEGRVELDPLHGPEETLERYGYG
jgi:hypothetical protein